MNSSPHPSQRGYLAAVIAFTLWGLLPGYWKALGWLSPGQVICLRALLTLPVLVLVLLVRRQFTSLCRRLSAAVLGLHAVTAALLAGNWLAFVWATHHGRIVEASLGYFLTPLANVALGALLLRERLRSLAWAAVALAAAGVALQVLAVGHVPWVALSLCGTFAVYGLLRKRAALDSLEGLTVESLVALPVAALVLGSAPPAQLAPDARAVFLLLIMGVITAVPLLTFAYAARVLPLSALGLLQFIAPSLQFLVGSVVYQENVTPLRMFSFGLIWLGLAVFVWDHQQHTRA